MDRYMDDPDYGPPEKLLLEWTEGGGLGTAAATNARAVLAEFDECKRRLTQLENTLRAILDDARWEGGTYEVDYEVIDEAGALLDGEGAPADTEEQR